MLNEREWYKIMFRFIKKLFVVTIEFIGLNLNLLNAFPLQCVSMSDQECNVRPATLNNNSNEPLFYPHNIVVNKCSSSSDNVNDPMPNYDFLVLLKKWLSKYLI